MDPDSTPLSPARIKHRSRNDFENYPGNRSEFHSPLDALANMPRDNDTSRVFAIKAIVKRGQLRVARCLPENTEQYDYTVLVMLYREKPSSQQNPWFS
jgi:hypothetical protein